MKKILAMIIGLSMVLTGLTSCSKNSNSSASSNNSIESSETITTTTTQQQLTDDEQHLENAKNYIKINDLENAKKELNAVTTDFKSNYEYTIVCTDYYLAKGDSGSAVSKIASFIENDSNDENIDDAKTKLQEVKFVAKKSYAKDMKKFAKSYKSINYKQLAKKPDKMFGKLVKIECEVSQVVQEGDYSTFLLAQMTKDEYGYYSDTIALNYAWHYDNEPRIIDDDKIIIYGQACDLYEYETVLGSTNKVPYIVVYYIDTIK